jgi:DNA helicase-2/ATP-dependent DNA helicase PcrA
VVGDADQSIYAFRGATIRNILEFERDYPDARTILLEQNYRSTQTILSAANAVHRPQHLPQAQAALERPGRRASRSSVTSPTPSTPRPTGWPARSTGSPTTTRCAPATWRSSTGTNAQSRVFEEVFIRVGLPYKVVGGVRFYERKEVRDALGYLRAGGQRRRHVSIRRCSTPRNAASASGPRRASRRLRPATASRSGRRCGTPRTRPASPPARPTAIATSCSCSTTCGAVPHSPAEEVLEAVLQRSGLLSELEESLDPQDQGRVENLQEAGERRPRVHEAGRGQGRGGESTAATLAGFLEQVALVADADQLPDDDPENQGVVTLMTLHTAKGLEFPVVFLTGLEDGVFPHMRALGDNTELEEERRLAYVGITRARQRSTVPGGHPWRVGPAAIQSAVPLSPTSCRPSWSAGSARGVIHVVVRAPAVAWAVVAAATGRAAAASPAARPRRSSWPAGSASTRAG